MTETLWAQFKAWLKEEPRRIKSRREQAQMAQEAAAALARWKRAADYFEQVRDPLLVEYAAYEMEAARRQYLYQLGLQRSRDAG